MPRLPDIPIADVAPSGPVNAQESIQASPAAFGGQIGQALEGLGAQGDRMGDVLAGHAIAMQGLNNETMANDAQTAAVKSASDAWAAYHTKEGKDAVAAYPDFQNQVMGIAQSSHDALPNPAAQSMFNQSFRRYVDMMLEGGSTYAADQQKAWHLQSSKASADTMLGQGVLFRQDPARVQTFLNTGLGEVQKQGEIKGWDQPTLADQQDQYKGLFYRNVVTGLANDDPAAAQRYYDSIKGDVPGIAQTVIESDLAKANKVNDAQGWAKLKSQLDDGLAAIQDTGSDQGLLPTGAAIQHYYGDDAPQMEARIGRARNFYAAKNTIGLLSPDEEDQLVQNFQPQGQDYQDQANARDALEKAIIAKHTALAKDPAGYVIGASPAAAALLQQALADPSKMPVAAAAIDADYDRLGVPEYARPLLPAAAAKGLVANIMATPPEGRAQQLTQMAASYGSQWPRVMGDLVAAKLPPEYEVLAAVSDPTARTMLADAIGNGKQKLRDGLAPADAKAIDAAVDGSEGLENLSRSFGYAAGGPAKAQQIAQAVKLMAYRYAATASTEDAVNQAVASVTGGKYDFWDQGDATARVPRGELGVVQGAAGALIGGLSPEALAVPANPSGAPLTPTQLQGIALDAARRGKWVTNEADNGLVRLDLNSVPVTLANGKRLELPFSAAESLARSPTAPIERDPALTSQIENLGGLP